MHVQVRQHQLEMFSLQVTRGLACTSPPMSCQPIRARSYLCVAYIVYLIPLARPHRIFTLRSRATKASAIQASYLLGVRYSFEKSPSDARIESAPTNTSRTCSTNHFACSRGGLFEARRNSNTHPSSSKGSDFAHSSLQKTYAVNAIPPVCEMVLI